MQPKTSVKFDTATFNRLKNNLKVLLDAKRSSTLNSKIPLDVGFQINHQCNLRCKTCFLWNDEGRNHHLATNDVKKILSSNIIYKVLQETKPVKSNLFFWGTEPLLHKEWGAICSYIENDPRWTVVCTNGILIEKQLDNLLKISDNLALLVSLDGLEKMHDEIRGKGAFIKTINNINTVLDLHAKNVFKGRISLSCVITNEVIPFLFDFVTYCEDLGVDTVYLGYPWYYSPEVCREMDTFYNSNFSWLTNNNDKQNSWYSYSYSIKPEQIECLKQQLKKISSKIWNIRVRFQPAVEPEEVEDFILGGKLTAQGKTKCLALSNRVDILADGSIATCKPFPEFCLGNINEKSLLEVWNSEEYMRLRRTLCDKLMPVCSKCVLLYLNGY